MNWDNISDWNTIFNKAKILKMTILPSSVKFFIF